MIVSDRIIEPNETISFLNIFLLRKINMNSNPFVESKHKIGNKITECLVGERVIFDNKTKIILNNQKLWLHMMT